MFILRQKIKYVAFRRSQALVAVTRPAWQEYRMLLVTYQDAITEGKANFPLDRNDKTSAPSMVYFYFMPARVFCKKAIRHGGNNHFFHVPSPLY